MDLWAGVSEHKHRMGLEGREGRGWWHSSEEFLDSKSETDLLERHIC